MYFREDLNGRPGQTQLAGLAEPNLQSSRAAIDAALKRNPVGGYVKGSAARQALDAAFESVPMCSALEFAQQLMKSEGTLERLFRSRLHPFTQQTMLRILARKAENCQEQRREELRRMDEEERRRTQEIRQMICASLARSDGLVAELCKRLGERSDECRTIRSDALKERERLLAQGFRCP